MNLPEFALPDSNRCLPPSRERAVRYTKPILRSIVPTNYLPCAAFIFSIVQRHLLTLCRCVRRAGKQNRTAILGLGSRCTNRCAIPANQTSVLFMSVKLLRVLYRITDVISEASAGRTFHLRLLSVNRPFVTTDQTR